MGIHRFRLHSVIVYYPPWVCMTLWSQISHPWLDSGLKNSWLRLG